MKHQARKRFGQNFLQDQHVIGRIIQAIGPKAGDQLIEIGPGLGALTLPLLRQMSQLSVIEIDHDLQQFWQQHPAAAGKLRLIAADALTIDYTALGSSLRIVGNLPYNISTPLLMHLLRQRAVIQDMHFMLQKEVVDRMAAAPGNKDYGRLSIICQYLCEVDCLFEVPPEAFDPQPKVDSAVVRLIPRTNATYPQLPLDALEQFTAKAFGMRRKTIANNLKGLMSADELEAMGVNPQNRPEQITVADYLRLTAKLLEK